MLSEPFQLPGTCAAYPPMKFLPKNSTLFRATSQGEEAGLNGGNASWFPDIGIHWDPYECVRAAVGKSF